MVMVMVMGDLWEFDTLDMAFGMEKQRVSRFGMHLGGALRLYGVKRDSKSSCPSPWAFS